MSQDNIEYLGILQQVVPLMGQTAKGKRVLIDSGGLKSLIDLSLDYSEPKLPSSFRQNEER